MWLLLWLRLALLWCFNPHTHAGCDIAILVLASQVIGFNPHTHAGCDIVRSANPNISDCFNPHTHAGCDSLIALEVYLHYGFQSTHPRRVWPYRKAYPNSIGWFQSTHPRRVWQLLQGIRIGRMGFQSTHPRRVWQSSTSMTTCMVGVSIHTPTQGVTLYLITYYKSANLIHCYANHHYYSTS